MYAKRLYKRCREGGKTIPGRHGACAPPSMSRGLVPRFSPSSGGRRTKAFVYATSGTKPGASDKGASAAPRQQGVSCGQPPLPLREFAPCRARRRIPRDALLIAGDTPKNNRGKASLSVQIGNLNARFVHVDADHLIDQLCPGLSPDLDLKPCAAIFLKVTSGRDDFIHLMHQNHVASCRRRFSIQTFKNQGCHEN